MVSTYCHRDKTLLHLKKISSVENAAKQFQQRATIDQIHDWVQRKYVFFIIENLMKKQ
jgi:hypothetical protein